MMAKIADGKLTNTNITGDNKMPKVGQRNAFTRYEEIIAELKKQLQDERDNKALKQFTDSLSAGIITILALKPYEQWPEVAKIAFKYNEAQMPTAAWLYKSKLPK
jgi:hypothetical protein